MPWPPDPSRLKTPVAQRYSQGRDPRPSDALYNRSPRRPLAPSSDTGWHFAAILLGLAALAYALAGLAHAISAAFASVQI